MPMRPNSRLSGHRPGDMRQQREGCHRHAKAHRKDEIGAAGAIGELPAGRAREDHHPAREADDRGGLDHAQAACDQHARREAQIDDVGRIERCPDERGDQGERPFARGERDRCRSRCRCRRGRRTIGEGQQRRARQAVERSCDERHPPAIGGGEPAMADLSHGDAERPAHDQHRHRRGELAAGEPVDDHLGEEDRGDHEAHAAQQARPAPACRSRRPRPPRRRPAPAPTSPAATSVRSEA